MSQWIIVCDITTEGERPVYGFNPRPPVTGDLCNECGLCFVSDTKGESQCFTTSHSGSTARWQH